MEQVRLQTFANYIKGFAFSSKDFSFDDTQTMVVRVSDFTIDSISKIEAVYIESSEKYKKYILHAGDILIQTVGSWANNPNSIVGKVVRVPAECDGSYLNQNIVKLLPHDINSTYLYYALKANQFPLYCVMRGQGAANQASITLDTIFRFSFPIHTEREQNRIADILSQYDTLIENNNKRIKVLEQMAESLYKEWFVRFRFPGYEGISLKKQTPSGWVISSRTTDMVCPEGWEYGAFSHLGSFTRGKNITAADMVEGDIPVVSAGLEPSGYHNAHNVTGKSLTISASGANAGYLKYHLSDIWTADCSYFQDDKKLWFIYNALKFLQPVISNLQIGAAQPHVYPKNINKLCTIIPDNDTVQVYCDKVEPIYEQIRILKEKNDNLTKQRDMLLPRLMSGKLKV